MSAENLKGRSASDFLTPDGRIDLKTIRASGYQGPLDLRGFHVGTEPRTGEPVLLPNANAKFTSSPDDTFWTGLGSGMNSLVNALGVYENKLIVGGRFTTAGGMNALYIASWDGSSWSPLGLGMNSYVYSLTVCANKLIVGGNFTTAGGDTAICIASWDGSSWSPLGSGMGGSYPYVYALAAYDNKLIAGGRFTTAGGVVANYIASWDGSSWSALGSGINSAVIALTVYDNKLIVGGWFTAAGGAPAVCIASWDGSSWSPLGSGMDNWVYALAVYDNKLIAGGNFTTAGGVTANRIASWDGSSWSPLGTGMNNFVLALTVYDNKLIVGGEFTTAGSESTKYIASWDGSSWSPLGSGLGGNYQPYVYSLTVYDNKLIAGGNFTTAGGKVSAYIAQWTKHSGGTSMTVGGLTIRADQFIDLGGGNLRAEGNVWIGNQTGQKMYLYLGVDAQVTFNINTGTVSSVIYTNVKLSSLGIDYAIDNIASLLIDAQAGRVSFSGRVHYASDAIFQSSFSGACTLEVNLHEFYGRIQFDDSFFGSGTVGMHAGSWDLDGCPFMGISEDINLTTPVVFTDLTKLDYKITVGVFTNTGIFRIGMTNSALEFKESGGAFGFDITGLITPPGVPSQGMIDVDLAHLRVNVVKDIPIGLWEYTKKDTTKATSFELNSESLHCDWKSLRKIDQNTYVVDVYDAAGNKYQKLVVDIGITIKGEEPYTDLDCDGYYDPGEPFEDEDGDGVWDEGTNIALLDQFQHPAFDAHGHATLDLTLAQYVNFTCADAVLDIDYPNNNIIKLQIWTGLQLGNIFTVNLASGLLSLDFQHQEYYADASFSHPVFQGLTFTGQMLVTFNPFKFQVGINQDFVISGVNIYGTGAFLRVDGEWLYLDSDLNAFNLLQANSRLIWKFNPYAVDGFLTSDFNIDGWHLAQLQNEFHFATGECMSLSASIRLCPMGLFCPGGKVTFRICSATDWGVIINGTYIRLKCPADLHVYDSQGKHTGLNQSGGIDLEIPGSEFYFSQDSSLQLIFIPGSVFSDLYTIDVKGESTGVIDLDVLYPNTFDLKVYDFTFFDEPTEQGALHRVILDSTNTWTMFIDLDGDSVFESQTEPDSTAEANLDTTMVIITGVSSKILCANEAEITWNTNVPATSKVLYRSEQDSVYKTISDTTVTTSHSVIVDNILTTETYYYIVVSIDTSGNIASFLEKNFKLEYVAGDVTRDGIIDIADVVYLINYLFKGGSAPNPILSGDCNCDQTVDVGDVVYVINYLFKHGPAPCGQ